VSKLNRPHELDRRVEGRRNKGKEERELVGDRREQRRYNHPSSPPKPCAVVVNYP
jgi:hypothetical protein